MAPIVVLNEDQWRIAEQLLNSHIPDNCPS